MAKHWSGMIAISLIMESCPLINFLTMVIYILLMKLPSEDMVMKAIAYSLQ